MSESAPGIADAVTMIKLDTTTVDTTGNIGMMPFEDSGPYFSAEVYPNPVEGMLHVSYKAGSEVHLRLLDLRGRLLYSAQLPPAMHPRKWLLDVSGYRAGVLILQFQTEHQMENVRIMKLD